MQYIFLKERVVTPEQGMLLGSSTPEKGQKFKMPQAHTRLIRVESSPPPPPSGSAFAACNRTVMDDGAKPRRQLILKN